MKELTTICKFCKHPIIWENKRYKHSKRHGLKCIDKKCEYEKCTKIQYGENYRFITPFGFLRLGLASAGYSAADIAEVCNRAKKDFLLRNYKHLNTGHLIGILKSKQFRTSSIDAWYVNTYKDMMGEEKETQTKVGLFKTKKEKTRTEGKMNAHQKKLYQEMVDDLIKTHRYRQMTSFLRTISKL